MSSTFFARSVKLIACGGVTLATFSLTNGKKSFCETSEVPAPTLYLWGDNNNNVVKKSSHDHICHPVAKEFFEKGLRHVSFGPNFAAAVDEKGDVYGWGRAFGENSTEPSLILKNGNIDKIVCTIDHVFALSKSGIVYPLAAKKDTQENPGSVGWFSGPETVAFEHSRGWSSPKILKLDAGLHHVIAVSNDGHVLALPNDVEGNMYGQLGLGNTDVILQTEKKTFVPVGIEDVSDGEKVIDVACGSNHSLALTEFGNVFAWGDDTWTQLCLGKRQKGCDLLKTSPVPVPLPKVMIENNTKKVSQVTGISSGGNTTAIWRQGVEEGTGELLLAGFGQYGSLGSGTYAHARGLLVPIPSLSGKFFWDKADKRSASLSVVDVSMGEGHVFATMSDGNTYSWGLNLCGQLGNGKMSMGVCKPKLAYSNKKTDEKVSLDSIRTSPKYRFVAGYATSAAYKSV